MRVELETTRGADATGAAASLFAVLDALETATDQPLLLVGDARGLAVDGEVDVEVRRLLARVCDRVCDHRLPVLALAPGPLVGAGLELALACDLRFAATGATLGLAGPPVGAVQRLVRMGGSSLATRMLVLGERPVAGADPTLERFLVVSDEPEADAAEALAALEAAGPLAVEAVKVALAAGVELPLSAGLAVEADLASLLLPTADRAEGLAAQRERRRPTFEGR